MYFNCENNKCQTVFNVLTTEVWKQNHLLEREITVNVYKQTCEDIYEKLLNTNQLLYARRGYQLSTH